MDAIVSLWLIFKVHTHIEGRTDQRNAQINVIRDCHRPYPDQLLPIKNSYLIYVKITDDYFNLQLNFNFSSF